MSSLDATSAGATSTSACALSSSVTSITENRPWSGRLFHDTGSLPAGKLEHIEASCRKRGVPFEWAFLMDALQAERDQNITIDVSQIWFRTAAGVRMC